MSRASVKRTSAERKPLSVRIDASLDRRVRSAAEREGLNLSEFVRDALVQRLERGPAETSLWDRIAPSVIPSQHRGGPERSRYWDTTADHAARVAGWLKDSAEARAEGDTHAEFAAGLEAEAATKWRRGVE